MRWNLRGKVPTCLTVTPGYDSYFIHAPDMQVPLRHWAIYIGRLSNTPTAAVEYRCLRAASESMGIPLPPPWVLLSIMLTFSKKSRTSGHRFVRLVHRARQRRGKS